MVATLTTSKTPSLQISKAQQKALSHFTHEDHPFHFYYGGTRSSKTDIAVLLFLLHVLKFEGCDFLIVSKTYASAARNVRPALKKYFNILAPFYNLTPPRSWGAGVLKIGSNEIHVVGCDHEGAQDKIFGMTTAGALIEEATRIPYVVIPTIIERGTVPGARTLFTTNPSYPRHKLRTEFLQEFAKETYVQKFNPWENPFLPVETLRLMKKLRTGAEHQRLWFGDWVGQEGQIYPKYELVYQDPHPDNVDGLHVFVDPGNTCYSVGYWLRLRDGTFERNNEYREEKRGWTARKHAHLVTVRANAICEKYQTKIRSCGVDPSPEAHAAEYRRLGYPMVKFNKDIYDGIVTTQTHLENGNLKINNRCKHWIGEADAYCWDPEKDDQPDGSTPDHAMDETRYLAMSKFPYGSGVLLPEM